MLPKRPFSGEPNGPCSEDAANWKPPADPGAAAASGGPAGLPAALRLLSGEGMEGEKGLAPAGVKLKGFGCAGEPLSPRDFVPSAAVKATGVAASPKPANVLAPKAKGDGAAAGWALAPAATAGAGAAAFAAGTCCCRGDADIGCGAAPGGLASAAAAVSVPRFGSAFCMPRKVKGA